jgi:sulfur-oxidizing protein SoxX
MWKPIGLFSCLLALAACSPESPFGFRLPDGDATAGRQAFLDLRCNSCHEVRGSAIEHGGGLAQITLGGQTTRVKTYGELVTSIINPSHKIAPPHRVDGATAEGASLMSFTYLNEVMTVQQLVDLVAFLQPTYEVVQPPADVRWYIYP